MARTEQESVLIGATPRTAYEAVSDVRRMGAWSPEATGAEVLTAGPIAVGTRFRGRNRRGAAKWTTECTVVAADLGREFAFEVRALGGAIARWDYEFTEEPEGVRVTETWRDMRRGVHGFLMSAVGLAVSRVWDRGAHNKEMMRTTLAHLKRELESTPASG